MKVPASLPKAAVYLACIMLVAHPRITAQAPEVPEQALDIHPIGPDMVLEWQSVVGRTYFLQLSGGLAPPGTGQALLNWAWADVIEEGHGGIISHEFGGNAPHGFARLHYTDEPRPSGVSLEEWDTDGDGRSNAAEINGNPQSNPLLYSTSGTGISDGWAVTHGLDPNDPSIGGLQFQQSGLTNLQASQAGVQAHPNATVDDRDGDLVPNEDDADPDDRVIDWRPGSHPSFAVIELGVDDVEELRLDDFTEKGTILMSRIQNYAAVGRVVIDSEQEVHVIRAGRPTAEEPDFACYASALVGDRVPGARLVGGSEQEFLWDPADNTFTPWQCPTGYHSDLRDERGGLLIGGNWLSHSATPGLRRSPNGDLLPDDEILNSWDARIEANGNVLSDKAYWRKVPLLGFPPSIGYLGDPVVLPESYWIASATLEQSGVAGMQKWNIVAGLGGVMVSKNDGTFVKAKGSLPGGFAYGATKQGWVVDQAFDEIWANGEWHDLKDCLGDPQIVEATGLGILDTGLAVARIRRANGPLKIALLLPVELGVDNNRDGTLALGVAADQTTAAKPYRFWLNNDDDRGWAEDTYIANRDNPWTPVVVDSLDEVIGQPDKPGITRDLEDFARLHLKVDSLHSQLAAGTMTLGLKWKTVQSGTPKIRLSKAVEADGGTKYLSDTAKAADQVSASTSSLGSVQGTTVLDLPVSFWTSTTSSSTKFFLFEAIGEGKGELTMVFKQGSKVLGEGGSVFLDLLDIRKMYEQWGISRSAVIPDPDRDVLLPISGVTAVRYHTPETGTPLHDIQPAWDENLQDKNYVICVHGWRKGGTAAATAAQ
jgi:hypothetical protein